MARAGPSSSSSHGHSSSSAQFNRSFCNTFWGSSDSGVPILFSHLRSSTRTTDDLRNFWRERALIEEEYANKLGELAGMVLGRDECGELRTALQTLTSETLKISTSHLALSSQIRLELFEPTSTFLNKQIDFRRTVQAPLEKKFKNKGTQEGYVAKAREKYLGDCVRIESYQTALSNCSEDEKEKLLRKLATAQQTVQLNERDYLAFLEDFKELRSAWNNEWKSFCDSSQDLDEERIEFYKDIIWTFANGVSTVCVNDDLACEAIRTALDQLEPTLDVESFILESSTGSFIPDPPEFIPYSSAPSGSSTPEKGTQARFTRKSKRAHHHHHSHHPMREERAVPETPPADLSASSSIYTNASLPNGRSTTPAPTHTQTQNAITPPNVPHQTQQIMNTRPNPPQRNPSTRTNPATARRESVPLPVPSISHQAGGLHGEYTPIPSSVATFGGMSAIAGTGTLLSDVGGPDGDFIPGGDGNRVLFYVKALYDYKATIDEEFSFQTNDIIAVFTTPDDGWWSGELLDEERAREARREGRHVFPSNFVCLF